MPDSKPPVAIRPLEIEDRSQVLESILGAVDIGVMLTDLDHATLAVNERFGQIFKVDISATVASDAETVRQFVHERIVDYQAWRENLIMVYGDPFSTQEDELLLKGPHQVLQRRTSPILNDDGEPFARLWTFKDITSSHHRNRIHELLQDVSTHFDPKPSAVYEKIVQLLSDFYESTCVLSILKGDMMHFQAIASPIWEIAAMRNNELANTYCQFCLELDGPILIQNALDTPRFASVLPATVGVTRYLGVPLRSPEGQILGTLCVLDHHSDRLLNDDDLRFLSLMGMRISGELEREAKLKQLEHDLETAESRMIQNEKLAITGTLSASIAHDIRNIVSAITVDLDSEHESVDDRLIRARTHMDRFNVLALRLLSYAKPKKVTRQSLSVGESINRVIDLLARHLQISKVEVILDLPDDLPEIEADSGRTEHLFMNLCLNALQAMKHRGKLTISAGFDDRYLTVRVTDTGPGMTPEQIEQAFLPFQSSRHDGFGLGLYSCQQIMREVDGSIAIETELGIGTTFLLRFPLK